MEIWKDAVGYDGLQVSNLGRIKRHGELIRPFYQNGYPTITLPRCKKGYVHRLVIEAFIGPIPDGTETHHKNGDRTDNRLENLEVVTAAEHQHRDFVLRCSHLEPIGPGGGMSMFDKYNRD